MRVSGEGGCLRFSTSHFFMTTLLPLQSMRVWRIVVVSVRVSRQGGRRERKEGILFKFQMDCVWGKGSGSGLPGTAQVSRASVAVVAI